MHVETNEGPWVLELISNK